MTNERPALADFRDFWLGCPGRHIGRCRNGHMFAADGGGVRVSSRCGCGARVNWRQVKGTVSGRTCDARCMGGRSTECQCSCGGKNHGSTWLLLAARDEGM